MTNAANLKVWIYSGITGSGKTTLVRKRHPLALRLSADDYFTKPDGSYDFVPAKIGEAHGWCFRRYIETLRDLSGGLYPGSRSEIVVDNTNTSVAELAPYAHAALSYGAELQIVTVVCDPAVAFARALHGAPRNVVEFMAANLAKRELPPWWSNEVVEAEVVEAEVAP